MSLERRSIALAGCAEFPTGHGDDGGVVEALADLGVDAVWRVWDEEVDWSAFEAVVVRQTWDYTEKLGAYLDWIALVEATTTLLNPPPVLRWNHHKRYLLELEDAGVPIVPTMLVPGGADAPAVPWEEAVVKPAVGVAGDGVDRVRGSDVRGADHDLLVQPYLRSIESAGETSVVVIAGAPSHAVVKVPAPGEHRAHEHRGGTYRATDLRPEHVAIAASAWAAAVERAGAEPVFGRVDLVEGPDGAPLLGELELIEPSLYLHHVPAAAATLAAALRARLVGPARTA